MDFAVTVSAGQGSEPDDPTAPSVTLNMPNPRAEGTGMTTAFTGGHLLNLAVAACVLNDIYREAQASGIALDAVEVSAWGGYAGDPAVSTGISYTASVRSPADTTQIQRLLDHVDAIAEIPNSLRGATPVTRVEQQADRS